ncbi:MAG: ATP-binding cassette domain-containing protein [Myxococcales bacterium]|nr:ATP-binding cassette domain-containing protein [Myxococcales bacterium]
MLELRGVHKAFGRHCVLRGVDLEVPRGEVAGLGGPNAAGKSTLLRVCAGLVSPDRGIVRVAGRAPQDARRRGLIAWSGEAGGRFQRRLSVLANLIYAASWSGTPRRTAEREIRRLAERFGLTEELTRRADACSLGTLQRAALVRVVQSEAALVLLDEPVSSIDPESSEPVRRALAEELRRRGCSALWVSHRPHEIAPLCNAWFGLDAGAVAPIPTDRAA